MKIAGKPIIQAPIYVCEDARNTISFTNPLVLGGFYFIFDYESGPRVREVYDVKTSTHIIKTRLMGMSTQPETRFARNRFRLAHPGDQDANN